MSHPNVHLLQFAANQQDRKAFFTIFERDRSKTCNCAAPAITLFAFVVFTTIAEHGVCMAGNMDTTVTGNNNTYK